MKPFTETVIDIIRAIPEGKVVNYGQIATMAGNPRAARQVSRILSSMSKKYHLPWHRVVNAAGKIVIKDPDGAFIQKKMLEDEGVEVDERGKIDLQQFGWDPEVEL